MKKCLYIFCSIVVLVLTGAACAPTPTPCPDIFNVTTNLDANDGACTADHCSLRDAVIAANACPSHQTIVVPAGNYQLTLLGADEDASATGDLDITDDVTLQGEGVPSIDGVTQDRLIEVFSPAVVEIDHFILINGNAQLGGAIRSHGELTVIGSSIHDNAATVPLGGAGASSGGGIFVEAGTTTLIGTQVFSNSADAGGGVHNFATATFVMTGGLLAGNSATMYGGGLWNNFASTAALEDVEVWRNTAAERGAGIYNDGTLNATLVIFNENADVLEGGGVYNDEDGEMFLYQAWFTNNNADLGGGLYNRGLLHAYQSSLTNNSALNGEGGGA
jgi:CSLREA domain-containing protein